MNEEDFQVVQNIRVVNWLVVVGVRRVKYHLNMPRHDADSKACEIRRKAYNQ